MFATLRCGSANESLVFLKQTDRLPPQGQGHQHSACHQCRNKKLRCSGQRGGCDRCKSQQLDCKYSDKCNTSPSDGFSTHRRRRRSTQTRVHQRSSTTAGQKLGPEKVSAPPTTTLLTPPSSMTRISSGQTLEVTQRNPRPTKTPKEVSRPSTVLSHASHSDVTDNSSSEKTSAGFPMSQNVLSASNMFPAVFSPTIDNLSEFALDDLHTSIPIDDNFLGSFPEHLDPLWTSRTAPMAQTTGMDDFFSFDPNSPDAMQRSISNTQRPTSSLFQKVTENMTDTMDLTSHGSSDMSSNALTLGSTRSLNTLGSSQSMSPSPSSPLATSSRSLSSLGSTCDCTQVALRLLEKAQTHLPSPSAFNQLSSTKSTRSDSFMARQKQRPILDLGLTGSSPYERQQAPGCDAAQLQLFKRAVVSLRRVASCERCITSSSFIMLLALICERLAATGIGLAAALKKIMAVVMHEGKAMPTRKGATFKTSHRRPGSDGRRGKHHRSSSSCGESTISNNCRHRGDISGNDVCMADNEAKGSSDDEYSIDTDEELSSLLVTLALVQIRSLRLLVSELAERCQEEGWETHRETLVLTESRLKMCETGLRVECLGA